MLRRPAAARVAPTTWIPSLHNLLAALLLGFRISKSAQTSNWEVPTFTQKQIEYAATDAWVCLELFHKLRPKSNSIVS